MKICNKCNLEKDASCFSIKIKSTGLLFNQCKACKNLYSKVHASRQDVKDIRREQKKKYWLDKKDALRPIRTKYMNEKRKRDINYRISNSYRATLSALITGKIKSTLVPIGCDGKTLKKLLEGKFDSGMNWTNYGEWEIDHIIPVSKFEQTSARDQIMCWHHSNLQPLWKNQNRLKAGGKLL